MVPCHWIIQCDHVHRIYPIEIEIKNTTDTDLSALYIDHLDTDTRLLTATKYMSFPVNMTYHQILTRVAPWVPLVEQELLTWVHPVLLGLVLLIHLFSVKCFVDHWLFVFFRLVILLHILLLFTAYSYYFGIFKQFMQLHHCNYFTDMWKLTIRCRLHLVINSLTRYCSHYFIRRLAERTKQKH